MTVCNVKGIVCSNKPIENYNPIRHYRQLNEYFLASFSLLFWIYSPQLYGFGSILTLSLAYFNAKALLNPPYTTCPALNSRHTKLATSW